MTKVQREELFGKDGKYLSSRLLYEWAVFHFIENHQMNEITGGSTIISRQGIAGIQGYDFETENALIEIKGFMASDQWQGCMKERFHQIIRQIAEHGNSFVALPSNKRKILLVVGQKGISKETREVVNQESIILSEKVCGMGVELWVAEIQFSAEGISLQAYQNVESMI